MGIQRRKQKHNRSMTAAFLVGALVLAVATAVPVQAADETVQDGAHLSGVITVTGKWTVPSGVTAYLDADVCVTATHIDVLGTLVASTTGLNGTNMLLNGVTKVTVDGSIVGANGQNASSVEGDLGKQGGKGSSVILKSASINLGEDANISVGAGGAGGAALPSNPGKPQGGDGGAAGWFILDGNVDSVPAFTGSGSTGRLWGADGGSGAVADPIPSFNGTTDGGDGGRGGGIVTNDDSLSNSTYGRDVIAESRDVSVENHVSCYDSVYTAPTIDSELQLFGDGSCNGADGADDIQDPGDRGSDGDNGDSGDAGVIGENGESGENGGAGGAGANAQGGDGEDGCWWGDGGDGGTAQSYGGTGGNGGNGGNGGGGQVTGGAGGTGGNGGNGGGGGTAHGGAPGCGGVGGNQGAPGVGTSFGGTPGEGGSGGSGGSPGGAPGSPGTDGNTGSVGSASTGGVCVNSLEEFI